MCCLANKTRALLRCPWGRHCWWGLRWQAGVNWFEKALLFLTPWRQPGTGTRQVGWQTRCWPLSQLNLDGSLLQTFKHTPIFQSLGNSYRHRFLPCLSLCFPLPPAARVGAGGGHVGMETMEMKPDEGTLLQDCASPLGAMAVL